MNKSNLIVGMLIGAVIVNLGAYFSKESVDVWVNDTTAVLPQQK